MLFSLGILLAPHISLSIWFPKALYSVQVPSKSFNSDLGDKRWETLVPCYKKVDSSQLHVARLQVDLCIIITPEQNEGQIFEQQSCKRSTLPFRNLPTCVPTSQRVATLAGKNTNPTIRLTYSLLTFYYVPLVCAV